MKRWVKKGKENKAGRKEMMTEEGGKERERERGICPGVALSVGKYLSNSFHSVKASLLFSFLQTFCLLIFSAFFYIFLQFLLSPIS